MIAVAVVIALLLFWVWRRSKKAAREDDRALFHTAPMQGRVYKNRKGETL